MDTGKGIWTKAGLAAACANAVDGTTGVAVPCSASTTHLRSIVAFKPLASAADAKDTPGYCHASTSDALYSSLCMRLRRRPGASFAIVLMYPASVKRIRASYALAIRSRCVGWTIT